MLLLQVLLMVIAVIFVALVAFVYLAPETATNLALGAGRYRAGLVCKVIELPSGLHFAYLEGGQGEVLMLLHGFGANKDIFTRVSRFLVQQYRVIIPDIVGFGESSRPAEANYSPPAQVERLMELSRALGIKELHIGGNSMGAQIAMIYASLYPEEVKSLWLLSPAGVWSAPESKVFTDFKKTGINRMIARNVEQFQQVMALGMENVPWIPKPILNVLAQERIKNAVLEDRVIHQIIDCSVEKNIDGMKTPTLIVFGDMDRVIPVQTAVVLQKWLPNASVKILHGIGHVPMFESPQQCANDYFSFRAAMQSMDMKAKQEVR